ncbi:unnamed protein product [Oppiella nova]|uniref:Uncharacterized protein n=1 Tax=Oppiella nova TaxID=334625 RepID=A0A7R9LA09_9ACAR|nr:unnamed protein product [Oppiella nova]CAG2161153.1 unnamed protein product [Oppiella nova]
MIYQWEKVKQNTLKECDISKLTGLWYAIYVKNQTQHSISMDLSKVSQHSLQFKHILNGVVDHEYDLVQNYDTLQGKLDRVIDRGDYQLGYPWWVLHTDYDEILVVYQCLILNDDPNDQNASEDVWTIYSRTKTITDDHLSYARDLLLKSGAKIDGSDEILFKIIRVEVLTRTQPVCYVLHLSDQVIYPYHKAVNQTLSELDLKSLEGHWYGVYHRNPKEVNGSCPELDVVVGNGYVNVTEIRGNNTVNEDRMEQNLYLKGKISKVIMLPAGNQTLSRDIVESGAQRLIEAGAVSDSNGTLDGHWYSVYNRSPINGVCPQLNIKVSGGGVNVVESLGNNTVFNENLVPNSYLKGKLEKLVSMGTWTAALPWYVLQVDPLLVGKLEKLVSMGTWTAALPWYVLQVDPLLVVYKVVTFEKNEVWSPARYQPGDWAHAYHTVFHTFLTNYSLDSYDYPLAL